MKAVRQRGTDVELRLREALDNLGLSYTMDQQPLPTLRRRADAVFERARVAVFVDGCFWHGCPVHGTWPTANAEWWKKKIETNRLRDADTDRRLKDAGWMVIRAWEHEDAREVALRVATAVRGRVEEGKN